MVNPKKVCPECKRTLRTKCFIYNKKVKKEICKQCDKRIGNNIFYVPFVKKQSWIGKYSMSDEEKKELHQKFMSEGLDSKTAWRKVNNHINILKWQKRKSRYSDKERKKYFAMKAQENKQLQKQFIGGLKNG